MWLIFGRESFNNRAANIQVLGLWYCSNWPSDKYLIEYISKLYILSSMVTHTLITTVIAPDAHHKLQAGEVQYFITIVVTTLLVDVW